MSSGDMSSGDAIPIYKSIKAIRRRYKDVDAGRLG